MAVTSKFNAPHRLVAAFEEIFLIRYSAVEIITVIPLHNLFSVRRHVLPESNAHPRFSLSFAWFSRESTIQHFRKAMSMDSMF